MLLCELLKNIDCTLLQGDTNIEIGSITTDSKKAVRHSAFICLTGSKFDGHSFAPDAAASGAACIIAEKPIAAPIAGTVILVKSTRESLPVLADNFYGRPYDTLNLIGITGTNGKTSVAYYLSDLLLSLQETVGLISTNEIKQNNEPLIFHKTTPTTPDFLDLQSLFYTFKNNSVKNVVMEVTSMALETGRVKGCTFHTAVFTNLSQDHLDDHGTMENYASAKLKLFKLCRNAVVNLDDPLSERILSTSAAKVLTYSAQNRAADLFAFDITHRPEGLCFKVCYKNTVSDLAVPIPGLFTVYNVLAAVGACISLDLPSDKVFQAVSGIQPVEGRFEAVLSPKGFQVIVDFAHTPNALQNVLQAARLVTSGKIITVFGCGGNRDPSKRSKMGAIAGNLSDFCIITSDNPRYEDPETIITMIEEGLDRGRHSWVSLPDRKEAILHALSIAAKGDCILICGKGHENYQEINGVKTPFNDLAIVKEYMLFN